MFVVEYGMMMIGGDRDDPPDDVISKRTKLIDSIDKDKWRFVLHFRLPKNQNL